MNFQIKQPRRVPLNDLIMQRDQERDIVLMPLERDLLIKRVKMGGHSGQFLADAFLSSYRTNRPFLHSLGEIVRLDAEGVKLFHQCLHIRHVNSWSDAYLYDIECDIKTIMERT